MAELREWAPDIDRWPSSWMGIDDDLEYGKKLLPYFEEFLAALISGGMARRTFVSYRDNAWLLGGTIISEVSFGEEYGTDPLRKLFEDVESDGVLPDDFDQMSESELRSFEKMCRRFEKFLFQKYGAIGVS